MWVGTEGGLSRFPRKPPPFVNYRHEPRNPNSLDDNPDLGPCMADSQGFLWIAGAGGLTGWIERPDNLLYRHDPKDPHSLPYEHDFRHPRGPVGHTLVWHLWRRTQPLRPRDGTILRLPARTEKPDSLSSDLVLSLLEDRQGRCGWGPRRRTEPL